MERRFLLDFMKSANAYSAAMDAGYSEIVASQAGDLLLGKPEIKRALRALRNTHRESVRQSVINATSQAVGTLVDQMQDPMVPPQVRVSAADKLLQLSGLTPPEQFNEVPRNDAPLEGLPAPKAQMMLEESKKGDPTEPPAPSASEP